jgi:hypothetical protein
MGVSLLYRRAWLTYGLAYLPNVRANRRARLRPVVLHV